MTYTISQIKAAGEKGEINHHDVNHLISVLQEQFSSPQEVGEIDEKELWEEFAYTLSNDIDLIQPFVGMEFISEKQFYKAIKHLRSKLTNK